MTRQGNNANIRKGISFGVQACMFDFRVCKILFQHQLLFPATSGHEAHSTPHSNTPLCIYTCVCMHAASLRLQQIFQCLPVYLQSEVNYWLQSGQYQMIIYCSVQASMILAAVLQTYKLRAQAVHGHGNHTEQS